MKEQYNANIMILNFMKFTSKKTGKDLTRIEFILTDELSDSKNYTGYSTIVCFYDGFSVFNKLNKGLLMQELEGTFNIKPKYNDTSSLSRMLVAINDISLL